MRYVLSLLILLLSMPVLAQKPPKSRSLTLAYGDSRLARNINLTYRHEIWNKWSLYGGLKYHINSQTYQGDVVPLIYITPDEHAYFSKIEATGFKEHIGIKLGIEKSYTIPMTKTELAGFYDFMYTYAGVSTVGGAIDSNGKAVLYTPWPNVYTTGGIGGGLYEHHVGVAIRAQAYKNVYLSINGGVGLYKYTNGVVFNGAEIFSDKLTFSRMYSFGIEYRLEKKKPQSRRR